MGKDIRKLQNVLIEMIKYIDEICRKNNIMYFVHGGTTLGAVRHKGFIPWDDDLDIAMTEENYNKFKQALEKENSEKYFLQEWHIASSEYMEYAKLRMNGTTFIEKQFMENKDIHQGIFVDIFILHKCPTDIKIQKRLFYKAHFVMGIGLSERGWKPKKITQKIAFIMYKILPKKFITDRFLRDVFSYDNLKENYKYNLFMDKSSFEKAIYDREQYEEPTEIEFEGLKLYCVKNPDKLLTQVYGNYMQLPPEEQRKKDIHAEIWDTEKDYTEYIK